MVEPARQRSFRAGFGKPVITSLIGAAKTTNGYTPMPACGSTAVNGDVPLSAEIIAVAEELTLANLHASDFVFRRPRRVRRWAAG
jgi:hypothetical protein